MNKILTLSRSCLITTLLVVMQISNINAAIFELPIKGIIFAEGGSQFITDPQPAPTTTSQDSSKPVVGVVASDKSAVTSNPNPQTENFNSFIYNFTNSINYPTSLGVRFVMGDIISFSQKSPYQTPGKMYNLLAELRKTQKIDEIELDQDKYKINSYLIPQELNIILGWIDIGLYSNSIVGSIMNIFSKKSFVEGMKYCIDQKQYQRIGIALNIFGILKLKCILGDLIKTTYNAVANKATTQHVLGDLVSDITIKIELDILSLSK